MSRPPFVPGLLAGHPEVPCVAPSSSSPPSPSPRASLHVPARVLVQTNLAGPTAGR